MSPPAAGDDAPPCGDLTDALRRWGGYQAQVRAAESALGHGPSAQALQEARRLREEADGLHRAIYRALGRPRKPEHPG